MSIRFPIGSFMGVGTRPCVVRWSSTSEEILWISDIIGHYRTLSDVFGRFRTLSDNAAFRMSYLCISFLKSAQSGWHLSNHDWPRTKASANKLGHRLFNACRCIDIILHYRNEQITAESLYNALDVEEMNGGLLRLRLELNPEAIAIIYDSEDLSVKPTHESIKVFAGDFLLAECKPNSEAQ